GGRGDRVQHARLDTLRRVDLVTDLEAGTAQVPDPQLHLDGAALVWDRREVFDLLARDEADRRGSGAGVDDRGGAHRIRIRTGIRAPERLDARLFEQAQHLGVVDVRVRVEVAPAQPDRDVDAGHVSRASACGTPSGAA